MSQRFLLDRLLAASYLALAGGACAGGGSASLLPAGGAVLEPAAIDSLVRVTQPAQNRLYRFRWKYRDEKGDAGGRGSARIAPPDSIRFDAFGPLGAGKMAAMAVGEERVWVEPEDAVEKLVPSYPLMWGIFGVARPAAADASVTGAVAGPRTAWQYANGADTVEYLRQAGSSPSLTTVVRRGGKVVGRAEVRFDGDGRPRSARLEVPSGPARLDLTFTESSTPARIAPDTWQPPAP